MVLCLPNKSPPPVMLYTSRVPLMAFTLFGTFVHSSKTSAMLPTASFTVALPDCGTETKLKLSSIKW